jgi:hypothetical protein
VSWLFLALCSQASAAEGMAGLSWTPLSRGDLAWVIEERTTGTGVGEFDGTVRSALTPFAGAWIQRVGLLGTLGVSRISTSSRTDGVIRQRHWGVVRPGLDVRWALRPRDRSGPTPWLMLGAMGSIPSARDTSNGYSEPEQDQADQGATVDRVRLGGIGGRLGGGVELEIVPQLSLGGELALEYYTSSLRANDLVAVTATLETRGAVLLTFSWDDPRTKNSE